MSTKLLIKQCYQHLSERRRMKLAWANGLDDLRANKLATEVGRFTKGY